MSNRLKLLFIIGLLVKIAFLFSPASHYVTDLFVPFLDVATLNAGSNPWKLMPSENFPYGSVLFIILWIPRYLAFLFFGNMVLGSGAIGLTLIKTPLLILDVLFLEVLRRMAPRKTESLLIFYWLNPVLFYITYIHGQLDIASTFFCTLSLFLLSKKQTLRSAVAMGAATLCKFHVVLIIPFMMVYLWNRDFAKKARKEIAAWISTWLSISVFGFLPLALAGKIGYATAASPEAFRLFAAQITYGPNQTLQLGVLIVLSVLGRLCLSTTITEKGLIFGSTILMSTLLLATDPMPGWYFWILPLFALFFSTYLNVPRSLFWLHNFVYLIYFVPISHRFLEKIPLGSSFAFTILQASLTGIIVALWVLSIRYEAKILRRAKPTTIGIAGDSGAGKNHLSLLIQDLYHSSQTLLVEGDDYHRWERGDENWEKYTHLNPRANDLKVMQAHTSDLSKGQSVEHYRYDHETGKFTNPRELKPAKAVILQGLHSFYLRGVRDRLDLRIFLYPDANVRLGWKLDRDVNLRGHSPQNILESMKNREIDSKKFINPQKDSADWIIEFTPVKPVSSEDVISGVRADVCLHHVIKNEPSVERALAALEAHSAVDEIIITSEVVPGEIDRLSIRYVGKVSQTVIQTACNAAFPNPRRITRGRVPPVLHSGFDGINQLMALALLETIAESEV